MAAGAAAEMGYTNLMIYQDGFPDWIMKGNPVKMGDLPYTFRYFLKDNPRVVKYHGRKKRKSQL